MKTLDIMAIPLSQGLFALVDGENYERLSKYKWYAHKQCTGGFCADRCVGGKTISMHRFIMNPPDNMQIDHINHSCLDNREANIRICTRRQNSQNRLKQKNNKSELKGVCFHRQAKKWQAQIQNKGVVLYLGLFNDKKEAARAYDNKARELFGEFAKTNF